MANVKTYYKSKSGENKVSTNFKVREFASKDGADKLLIDNDIIPILERFREYVEAPVTINSAYRTSSWNKKQGGASNSYHLYGRAFDIPFKSSYKNLTSIHKMCDFFNTLRTKRYNKISYICTYRYKNKQIPCNKCRSKTNIRNCQYPVQR